MRFLMRSLVVKRLTEDISKLSRFQKQSLLFSLITNIVVLALFAWQGANVPEVLTFLVFEAVLAVWVLFLKECVHTWHKIRTDGDGVITFLQICSIFVLISAIYTWFTLMIGTIIIDFTVELFTDDMFTGIFQYLTTSVMIGIGLFILRSIIDFSKFISSGEYKEVSKEGKYIEDIPWVLLGWALAIGVAGPTLVLSVFIGAFYSAFVQNFDPFIIVYTLLPHPLVIYAVITAGMLLAELVKAISEIPKDESLSKKRY